MNRKTPNVFLTLLLLFTFGLTALPQAGYAQSQTVPSSSASALEAKLQTIESKVEARRKELGIPGMSLVIVKGDQVIYSKGLGYKDFENKVPVTADTQFGIGSATKAFTALSVLMTQDEGKLSLDDSPKKLLPYFKMYDPETDKNITIRDLLSHSSGLNRTDLAMITGRLSRAELIQVAAQAKPTAKLREKWQYQNIMFTAAGEIVSQAQKMPWEKFVPERILKPLGMNNTSMLIREMEKTKDHSFGYDYNFDTKETTKRPFREIEQVAPAGSINSSANDMGRWLRFILAGGTIDGKRLVSDASFAEWIKPQMKMNPTGTQNYGLGWFLRTVGGRKVVEHGGNIDGFNALVAMAPESKVGFVMLTNVSASSLGNDIMPMIFSTLLDEPKAEAVKLPLKTMQFMAGKYGTEQRSVEVKIEGEDLYLVVPGQPPYKLERTGPRQFKPVGMPDGFGAKFTPETGDATEIELIQPQGNRKLARLGLETKPANSSSAKELIGSYSAGGPGAAVEIKETDGKVTFNISGQQPYTLTEKAKDTYAMSPLPESFFVTARRDAGGRLTGVAVTQPEGTFEFKRVEAAAKPVITVDELSKKVIAATGGEANWRKLNSRVVEADVDFVHQGIQAKARSWAKAPNKSATEMTLLGLGKTIASGWEYFDGTAGADAYTFAPVDKYEGKRLDDVKLGADFYGSLDWSTPYKKVEISGTAKVGDEETYVVSFEPKAGTPFKEYYSTTTFLLLKREGVVPMSTSSMQLPYTITYSDYREVDGVKMAFRTVNNTISNGDVVNVVKSVKHNVAIDDKLFAPRVVK